jgi:hypothetical protein
MNAVLTDAQRGEAAYRAATRELLEEHRDTLEARQAMLQAVTRIGTEASESVIADCRLRLEVAAEMVAKYEAEVASWESTSAPDTTLSTEGKTR